MEGHSLPHIDEDEDVIDGFFSSLSNDQVQVACPELVFGTLYDRIGYGTIQNRMFRNIVICRLFNPGSKLKTMDYMERYLHVTYSVDRIYRFLDSLCYRKEEEAMVKFYFITRITKFSQLSIFSTINNLTNVTFDLRFATICGITDEELSTIFTLNIEELAKEYECTPDVMFQKLKMRYDEYHFSRRKEGVPTAGFEKPLVREWHTYLSDTANETFSNRYNVDGKTCSQFIGVRPIY